MSEVVIEKVSSFDLQRVAFDSFEHSNYAFMIKDLSLLTLNANFTKYKSVFRVEKSLIDNEDFLNVSIINERTLKINKKYFKASYF